MTERPDGLREDDLHDYVDGRLTPERRAGVEAALARDPEAAATVAAYRAQLRALKDMTDPILEEPLPERLVRVVRPRPQPWFGVPGMVAAAALVVGVAVGWLGHGYLGADDNLLRPFLHEAVLAHQLELARSGAGERLVVPEGEDYLSADMIPSGFTAPVRAPTLRKSNLVPVAITSSAGEVGQAITITYLDESGKPVTVYIRETRKARDIPVQMTAEDGVPVLYWLDGPLVYVVVGQGDEAKLLGIAEQIYRSPAVVRPGGAQKVSE